MAYLKLYRNKLKHNYKRLDRLFTKHNIDWAIVTKLLCGNKTFLEEVINLGAAQVCDSRLTNLKVVKAISTDIETVYIKPPAASHIKNVVKYADISFNTSYETIKLLAREARTQKKKHKVIIMIEMGDLREGVLGHKLVEFYRKVFKLKGVDVIGIGANLNCLHGVMPSQDKLIQLSLYKQILELKFNRKIQVLSGGTTVAIPLIHKRQMPREINHFRVGEALFFGADLFTGGTLKGMYNNVFELCCQIIEIEEKPAVPVGELQQNPSGEVFEINEDMYGKKSYRAIIDLGLLDINPDFLSPIEDENIKVIGASSDMLVIDLEENPNNYKVGSIVKFHTSYMGALGLMNSKYIEKVVI
ncbi:MAG: alanine racemase [Bacteriovoracaceae bacterium]|nr:alanine racemase [Bacteriovoracaceae bacterium]